MNAPGRYNIERVRILREIDFINRQLDEMHNMVYVITYNRNEQLARGNTTFRLDSQIEQIYFKIHEMEQLRRRMYDDLQAILPACNTRRQNIIDRAHRRASEKSR